MPSGLFDDFPAAGQSQELPEFVFAMDDAVKALNTGSFILINFLRGRDSPCILP
jgi:hypothetical protein